MFLRYFACTDESPLGHTAAVYCEALVATGVPVRLVPTRAAELQTEPGVRFDSIWDKHRNLLVTPMDGDFVNLVCGEVSDWAGYYTNGVTNALLLSAANLASLHEPTARVVLVKYEHLYVIAMAVGWQVERLTGVMPDLAPDAFRNLKVF